MILEPQKLDDSVVIFEGKTRRGKAWDEFSMDNNDKTILSSSEWNMINGMSNSIFENNDALKFINDSKKEIVEIWDSNTTDLKSVKCKGKADMVVSDINGRRVLIDLKTTKDASLEAFRRSSWSYGYDRQAAFYMDGFDADEFWFIVIEKDTPYRMGIYKAGDEFLNEGRKKNQILLDRYSEYFISRNLKINEFYFKGEL